MLVEPITMEPIDPVTVMHLKLYNKESIPDSVFIAINQLIIKHWKEGRAKFYLKELIECILCIEEWTAECSIASCLDIEVFYRSKGWSVNFSCDETDVRFAASGKAKANPKTSYFLFCGPN